MNKERTVTLPTERTISTLSDPLCLVVYSQPKMGKTTLVSHLPNCLILDFEGGSKYIDGMKIEVENFKHLTEIGKEVVKNKKPYDFVVIDTLTALEDWCLWDATEFYMNTSQGKNFNTIDDTDKRKPRSEWEPVINLANGYGYKYLRESYRKWMDKIMKLADRIILTGHVKDKFITTKIGEEVCVADLDLTGKNKWITTQHYADSIGYLSRDIDSNPILNFVTSEEVACGSRAPHLRGKTIKLADFNKEKNELENVQWELIYPDLLGK